MEESDPASSDPVSPAVSPAVSHAVSPALSPALSQGTLLGGRITYRQPLGGFRSGIEPILLAASVPARPGECVVEAGTGAGAGLLALASRVALRSGLGIEHDPDMAGLASANFSANGQAGLAVLVADVAGWRGGSAWDHAMANPPWHDPAGTPSPIPGRCRAKLAASGLLGLWCTALARALRRRGTLSLVLPASSMAAGMAALVQADCGETTLLPLWKQAGQPARLVILRGVRQGRGACRILPGLALHRPEGGYTDAAEDILRRGAALPF